MIESLLRTELQREPLESILEREECWNLKCGTTDKKQLSFDDAPFDPTCEIPVEAQVALVKQIDEFSKRPISWQQDQYWIQEWRSLSLIRLLLLDVALRRWKDIHGRYPELLADIVPGTLDSLPLDPFTDRGFIYRTFGESIQLYITGPDKVDNGGRFSLWYVVSTGGYDYGLDSDDIVFESYQERSIKSRLEVCVRVCCFGGNRSIR